MSRRLTGQNATMPDVPLYVAAITAAAGVAGAAIPAIAVIIRDVRQAERDRRERRAEAKRQACLDLLRTAGELRTRVANTLQDPGDQIGARQAEYHDPPTGLLRARRKRRGLPADRCGRRRGIAYRRSSELSPTSFWAAWRWWGGSGGSVALRARLASSWAAILSPPRASARAA